MALTGKFSASKKMSQPTSNKGLTNIKPPQIIFYTNFITFATYLRQNFTLWCFFLTLKLFKKENFCDRT